MKILRASLVLCCLVIAAGCGGNPTEGHAGGHGPPGGAPGMGGRPSGESTAAVPVEVVPVVRRGIASYIETNGTLEADNEVDIVARTAGPVVELLAEEGDEVTRGQLLARLDDIEYRTQLEIARVTKNETRLSFERAKRLNEEQLISPEAYEQALAGFESATAQYEGSRIQLGYTEIQAPFSGKIIQRYVDLAEQVSANAALFRISDFDPLLCPIQIPERALPRLRVGQSAYLTVEPYPEERFEAEVLRIRPVVDADSGTVRVTLEVKARGLLRPGMFARVYVETDRHEDALVVPKAALSLESIGDTVYVADGPTASRREVELGFTEGDHVEILSGVAEAESVIVVGQDGLSDRTPIEVLEPGTDRPVAPAVAEGAGPRPGGGGFDPSNMTPEQLERAKEMMRSRGMTEKQIDERLERMRERAKSAGR